MINKPIKIITVMLLIILLLSGCAQNFREYDPLVTESIIYHLTGGGDMMLPVSIKEITLYPDGTGELIDREWTEDGNAVGPVKRQYAFRIPTEAYKSLESAVEQSAFISLPEDMGFFAADASDQIITVAISGQSYSSGGYGIRLGNTPNKPGVTDRQVRRWNQVADAFWAALEEAAFEDGAMPERFSDFE